jgi:hypothetical protein
MFVRGFGSCGQAARQQLLDAVAFQQLVVEGDEETRATGVALASGAPAQLVVDANAFVTVGADDVEAPDREHALAIDLAGAAELDVGAAPRHVGGDGHRAGRAGVGDDCRLPLVVLGVEHLVRDAAARELGCEALGVGDTGGADQDGPAAAVCLGYLGQQRGVARLATRVDDVGIVHALTRTVRRDGRYLEPVDLAQLDRRRARGRGHSGETRIEA